MERERLTRLLEEPGRATREDAAALGAMAEQYPWFTGAQLLRAASERAQGNVLADEALRIAAAHLPSRAVLHDLVQRASAPPAPLRVVKPLPAPPATTDAHEAPAAAPSVSEHVAIPLPPIAPPAPEARVEPEPAGQAHAPASGATAPEPVRLEAEAPRAATVIMPSDAPLQERWSETPQPGPMELDEVPPAPSQAPAEAPLAEQTTANDALDRQITEAALASAFDLTYLESLRTPPAPSEPAVAQPEPESVAPLASPASRLRFTDWLATASSATASSALPLQRTPSPAAAPVAPVGTQPQAATAAALPPPPAKPATQEGALSASTLIDRFIRQQPPEIPPKPAFFTPQQAAKKSLDDTAGLVTETLARIYQQQGNIPKAIEAYRRLALKYPEKSAYFAALSKALEEQQTP